MSEDSKIPYYPGIVTGGNQIPNHVFINRVEHPFSGYSNPECFTLSGGGNKSYLKISPDGVVSAENLESANAAGAMFVESIRGALPASDYMLKVNATLREFRSTLSAFFTGVSVHNERKIDKFLPIEGPIIDQLKSVYNAIDNLLVNPSTVETPIQGIMNDPILNKNEDLFLLSKILDIWNQDQSITKCVDLISSMRKRDRDKIEELHKEVTALKTANSTITKESE